MYYCAVIQSQLQRRPNQYEPPSGIIMVFIDDWENEITQYMQLITTQCLSQSEAPLLLIQPLKDKRVEIIIELQSFPQNPHHLLTGLRVRVVQRLVHKMKVVEDAFEPSGQEGFHHSEGDVPLLDHPHHTVLGLHHGLRLL